MRPFGIALALTMLLAVDPAVAAGPYWHRSISLHYDVAADGTSTADEVWEVRADTNAIAQSVAQQSYSFIADLEHVDLVAAYTRKADGLVVPVPPGSLMDQAVTTTAAAPQFSAMTARTIIFPQVRAGDTVHYELHRTIGATMFPGEFTLDVVAGSVSTTERAEISIGLAPGRTLRVATAGLVEQAAQPRADGGETRRWALAPYAGGMVSLEASTFADYAALGRAYAVRAEPAARPSERIRALADHLAPAGLTPRETVRHLYNFVGSEIRYVATFLGKGRVVPRDAETVLAEGWGDCKDHTALLVALLAARNIEATPALISLHNRYDLPAAPGLGALDHVITYVPSLDLFLDSTAPYAPFGVLLAGEYDKPVVLADAAHAALSRTPPMPPGAVTLTTRTEARIEDDRAVSGETVTIAAGPQAITLRSVAAWLERSGTAQAAASQLQQLGTPGTGRYAFETPDNASLDYRVEGRFALDDRLPADGAVPFPIPSGLGVFGHAGGVLLDSATTEDGAHACYAGGEIEDIVLGLPQGARLAVLPPEVDVSAGAATYTAQYAVIDGALHVRRAFRVATDHQRCTPAEFEAMRGALIAAHRDQQARISLLPKPPQLVASGRN